MISLSRVQFLNLSKLFYCYLTDFNLTSKCFGFGSIVFQPDFQFNVSPVFYFDVIKYLNCFSFVWNFTLISCHTRTTFSLLRLSMTSHSNTGGFPNFCLLRQSKLTLLQKQEKQKLDLSFLSEILFLELFRDWPQIKSYRNKSSRFAKNIRSDPHFFLFIDLSWRLPENFGFFPDILQSYT